MNKTSKWILKLGNIILVFVLVLPCLLFPSMGIEAKVDTNGKTLADLRRELEEKRKEKDDNENQIKLTEEEINRITTTISENVNTINSLSDELITLQEEITEAEKDIEEKDKEIKEIVNFLQVSSGESAYLEYAFGAKDFTDFIYRMAISEQLSTYNEELVAKYNELIESNKKKKEEIKEKQEALRKKQAELEEEKSKLGNELKTSSDTSITIDEEIKTYEEQIAIYESYDIKCEENELLTKCVEKNHVLPPGTKFYRPIVTGRVTSEFGRRCYWLNGVYKCDLHGAIDLAQSGDAVPIYASAPGIVQKVFWRWSCGGNQVVIIHNINGEKYTTMYSHLRTIMVDVGDVVTMDTQIATMGGDPSREYWDGCSTGQHVHFMIATGHYGIDYFSWSSYESHMINPRTLLNVPPTGGRFDGRYTKY